MKLSDYTKKDQEILIKDNRLALCPNCGHIVSKTDNYCSTCGNELEFIVLLSTLTQSRRCSMNNVIEMFNLYCQKKYEKLRSRNDTYGDLFNDINTLKYDFGSTEKNRENILITNAISNKLLKLYHKDIKEKTIG